MKTISVVVVAMLIFWVGPEKGCAGDGEKPSLAIWIKPEMPNPKLDRDVGVIRRYLGDALKQLKVATLLNHVEAEDVLADENLVFSGDRERAFALRAAQEADAVLFLDVDDFRKRTKSRDERFFPMDLALDARLVDTRDGTVLFARRYQTWEFFRLKAALDFAERLAPALHQLQAPRIGTVVLLDLQTTPESAPTPLQKAFPALTRRYLSGVPGIMVLDRIDLEAEHWNMRLKPRDDHSRWLTGAIVSGSVQTSGDRLQISLTVDHGEERKTWSKQVPARNWAPSAREFAQWLAAEVFSTQNPLPAEIAPQSLREFAQRASSAKAYPDALVDAAMASGFGDAGAAGYLALFDAKIARLARFLPVANTVFRHPSLIAEEMAELLETHAQWMDFNVEPPSVDPSVAVFWEIRRSLPSFWRAHGDAYDERSLAALARIRELLRQFDRQTAELAARIDPFDREQSVKASTWLLDARAQTRLFLGDNPQAGYEASLPTISHPHEGLPWRYTALTHRWDSRETPRSGPAKDWSIEIGTKLAATDDPHARVKGNALLFARKVERVIAANSIIKDSKPIHHEPTKMILKQPWETTFLQALSQELESVLVRDEADYFIHPFLLTTGILDDPNGFLDPETRPRFLALCGEIFEKSPYPQWLLAEWLFSSGARVSIDPTHGFLFRFPLKPLKLAESEFDALAPIFLRHYDAMSEAAGRKLEIPNVDATLIRGRLITRGIRQPPSVQ